MIKELKKIKAEYEDRAEIISSQGIKPLLKEIKATKKYLYDKKYEMARLQMYLSLLEKELKKK